LVAGDCVRLEPGLGGGPMSNSLSGSGLILPSSELLKIGGICRPADPGCSFPDFCTSIIKLSVSFDVGTTDANMPDLRFIAFWIGLSRTLPLATLLGVATFLLIFFDWPMAASGRDMPSPEMSISTVGSIGEVAFELGAVLGLV